MSMRKACLASGSRFCGCIEPDVSMMKMMYSLSTGTPPIGESSLRRNCAPSSRFCSSVRSCCADTSRPSMSFATSASLRDDSNWPRSALRYWA